MCRGNQIKFKLGSKRKRKKKKSKDQNTISTASSNRHISAGCRHRRCRHRRKTQFNYWKQPGSANMLRTSIFKQVCTSERRAARCAGMRHVGRQANAGRCSTHAAVFSALIFSFSHFSLQLTQCWWSSTCRSQAGVTGTDSFKIRLE